MWSIDANASSRRRPQLFKPGRGHPRGIDRFLGRRARDPILSTPQNVKLPSIGSSSDVLLSVAISALLALVMRRRWQIIDSLAAQRQEQETERSRRRLASLSFWNVATRMPSPSAPSSLSTSRCTIVDGRINAARTFTTSGGSRTCGDTRPRRRGQAAHAASNEKAPGGTHPCRSQTATP